MFLVRCKNRCQINKCNFKDIIQRPWKNLINMYILRTMSHNLRESNSNSPFMEFINERQNQAKRSILVQVQSAQSHKELHSYCSNYGTINQMIHYTSGNEPMHFIIVEFTSQTSVNDILTTSCYNDDSQAVPANSSFLWFRASNQRKVLTPSTDIPKLNVENGNSTIQNDELQVLLQHAENISDQMKILYNATKLNDTGTRLRFLTANQIEQSVTGMFPYAKTLPFGSSVNGYGKMGCDLDLVLKWNDTKDMPDSRLVFQCKAANGSERSQSQRHMETLGDLIQLFLPGCIQVRRILQARVPIIKYNQQLTDVECDLSMTNMTGIHMSELLYLWGSIDDRVQPLVFTIKKWAQEVGVTNSSPGRWITNFSLTLLALAFLQNPYSAGSTLPSLNTLIKHADTDDRIMTDDGVDCTFLRDPKKLPPSTTNKSADSLETLLLNFFEFYASYDYAQSAVCLNRGVPITKPDHSPLYIVNPLEKGLNVSKNVSLDEVERFKQELRNASWIIESQEKMGHDKSSKWGILQLFESTTQQKHLQQFYQSLKPQRLMTVKSLFAEEQEESTGDVEYKNRTVKLEVEAIKKHANDQLKKLHVGSQKKLVKVGRKSKR